MTGEESDGQGPPTDQPAIARGEEARSVEDVLACPAMRDDPLPGPACPARDRGLWRALFAILFVCSAATHLYGSAAPLYWGHYGFHTAEYGLRARNCHRHGSGVCLHQSHATGVKKPAPDTYYLHHPPFWVPFMVATTAVFGDDPLVIRVTGILATLLCLVAIFWTLWHFWDPPKAFAGALLFALMPHILMFGTLPHTEQPALALTILSIGLLLRVADRARPWRLAAAFVCIFLAGQTDWLVYVAFDFVATWWLGTALLRWLRNRRAPAGARVQAQLARAAFEGVSAAVLGLSTIVLFGLHLYHSHKAGVLSDVFTSATIRARGDNEGFWKKMEEYGTDSFSELGLILIAAAVAYAAGRSAVRAWRGRVRAADVIPWALLVSFLLYMVVFKDAMTTHRYRWFFLAGAAAYFLADFLVDLGRLLRRWLARLALPRAASWLRPVAATPVACVAVLLALDAPHVLEYSRQTSGTWDEHYDSQYPQLMFAEEVRARTKLGDVVAVHTDLRMRKEIGYTMDRDLVRLGNINPDRLPKGVDYAVLIAPSRSTNHKGFLSRYKVDVFGHFWLVHLHQRGPDLSVFELVEEAPDPAWWFFTSSVYPPLAWRRAGSARAQQVFEHYGLTPGAPTWESTASPRYWQAQFDQAQGRGDKAAADLALGSLQTALAGRPAGMLTPEIELLGYEYHRDLQVLDVYLFLHGPVKLPWALSIHGDPDTGGKSLDFGGFTVPPEAWKQVGRVVRLEYQVWHSGAVDLRIALWRPNLYAPPLVGGKAGLAVGRLDLGTQYRF